MYTLHGVIYSVPAGLRLRSLQCMMLNYMPQFQQKTGLCAP